MHCPPEGCTNCLISKVENKNQRTALRHLVREVLQWHGGMEFTSADDPSLQAAIADEISVGGLETYLPPEGATIVAQTITVLTNRECDNQDNRLLQT